MTGTEFYLIGMLLTFLGMLLTFLIFTTWWFFDESLDLDIFDGGELSPLSLVIPIGLLLWPFVLASSLIGVIWCWILKPILRYLDTKRDERFARKKKL